MSIRTVIEVALGIVFLVLAYFFFTQSTTLSDTEAMLESAQASGTIVAESAANAQSDATQFADSANEASTEVAIQLDDAQNSATQLADSANEASIEAAIQLDDAHTIGTEAAELASENEAHIVATATQSALQAADDLSMMQATVTQNADILSAFQADATEFSNNSATQQAELMANAQATASNLQTRLDNSVYVAMTQDDQIDTFLATVHVQATALAEIAQAEADATINTTEVTLDIPDDFVVFKTNDFEMYVPSDYLVFDIEEDQDEAIEAFSELGSLYSELVAMARAGTDEAVVVGALNTPENALAVDNLIIATEDTVPGIPMNVFLESIINFFPPDADILEQEIIIVNEREFGRVVISMDFGFVDAYVIMYITMTRDDFYIMVYTTTDQNFEERQAGYETSLASFRLRD